MSCKRHAHLDPQSEEYQMWKQSHLVDDKCTFDFDGSANAIEAAGAVGVGQYPNTTCGTLHLLEMVTAKPILLLLIANHTVMLRFQKVTVLVTCRST